MLSKLSFSMIRKGNTSQIKIDDAKRLIDDFLKEGRKDYKDIRDELLKQVLESNILIKNNDHKTKILPVGH